MKARKKRIKQTFSRYDTADYLKSDEDMLAYLDACMEVAGDDPAFMAVALGNIARAHSGRKSLRASSDGSDQ